MNNKSIEDFFYSPKEKFVFWVAGYTDNSLEVGNIIDMLKENTAEFKSHLKNVKIEGAVKTSVVEISRRYKNCRYFWATVNKPPPGVFKIGRSWTMHKWLQD